MNNTKKLPDAYVKNTDSNLYKLIQLANLLDVDQKCDLEKIAESRDIQLAKGKTLDRYGEMFGVFRNGATDDRYRIKILNQVNAILVSCDCNSILNAIARMLDMDIKQLQAIEMSKAVHIIGLTMEKLQSTGYTSAEMTEMIKKFMPIGTKMSNPMYAGTLKIYGYYRHIPAPEAAPTLYSAWVEGQLAYEKGQEVGLKGYGEVPESFHINPNYRRFPLSGTYEGGTIGIITGEDE